MNALWPSAAATISLRAQTPEDGAQPSSMV